MNNMICFASNREVVENAFKDYMHHYMSEVEKRDGYMYDNTVNFSEKEEKINKLMFAEISKLAGLNFSNDIVSKEMMASNPMLRWASFAVVNSMIDMIVPEVLDKTIGVYTETRYIGYGDTAEFTVEPNDLFYVSKAGRDMRTTEFQRAYNSQVTVNPENRAISVSVNFYKVICGKESLAKFVMKAVMSLEAQITKEIYTAFNTAMAELPTSAYAAQLYVAGWSQDSAIKIAQRVSAFNGGAEPVFMGTKLALNKVLPANGNYRYDIQSDYVKVGYIKDFMGYNAMEMRQVADWKNPYNTVLDDSLIYIISTGSQKPVKLVYEGASRTTSMNFEDAADMTASTTINKSYGIGIATNAIAGLIDIDAT